MPSCRSARRFLVSIPQCEFRGLRLAAILRAVRCRKHNLLPLFRQVRVQAVLHYSRSPHKPQEEITRCSSSSDRHRPQET